MQHASLVTITDAYLVLVWQPYYAEVGFTLPSSVLMMSDLKQCCHTSKPRTGSSLHQKVWNGIYAHPVQYQHVQPNLSQCKTAVEQVAKVASYLLTASWLTSAVPLQHVLFLSSDAMLARYMPSSCVCLSVCLSQIAVLPKRLNVRSRKQRHTIARGLYFSRQRSRQNSNEVTPNGCIKCRWDRLKLATFNKYLAITRKRRPSQALSAWFRCKFITSVHLCSQHVCRDARDS